MKKAIQSKDAPAAIGAYSQAMRAGDTVYVSGQIGLDPATMQLADGIEGQTHRVFRNLAAVADAAGLTLDDAVRMTVYLTDLAHFARVNEIMAQYVREPYPSRAAIGVAGLPRGALVETAALLQGGWKAAPSRSRAGARASTSCCTCRCATRTKPSSPRLIARRRASLCRSRRASSAPTSRFDRAASWSCTPTVSCCVSSTSTVAS